MRQILGCIDDANIVQFVSKEKNDSSKNGIKDSNVYEKKDRKCRVISTQIF